MILYLTEEAFRYTQGILNRSGAVALKDFKLYSKPATAFHYCYGRNKRKDDGSVVLKWENGWFENDPTKQFGWYMPGIRELEVALTQYYTTFSDFEGNLYLSGACGKNNNRVPGEDDQNCRATKVIFDSNGKPTYVESKTGKEGAVRRDAIHRIRAFYKVK